MKILKYILILILIPIFLILLYLNIALLYGATCDENENGTVNTEVVQQLNFIKTELESGVGEEMQGIYPEGYVFIYSLYGLAWADIGETLKPNSDLHQKAIQELDWTIEKLNSALAKSIFPDDLTLKYGAYYRGWTNCVLAKKLVITPENQRDSTEIKLLQFNCDEISEAINAYEYPYLPSYDGQAWQADNILCLASLAIHDKIFEPRYADDIEAWLMKIKETVDKETGLIGHFFDYQTNQTFPARGSSQSLINAFLFEIDSAFANAQTAIYKDKFLTYRFGLPGIREYPKGTEGSGDIDSGPVIWNIGGAASIVGIRTMGLAGETAVYKGLRNSVQAFGVGLVKDNQKQFLFGKLPIADAFIAWANAKNCQISQEHSYWQWKFQLLNLGILALFGGLFGLLLKPKK
ncbi:MAG: hypothetical protein ACI97N_002654 [Cognaticolwellia sp.]|jgi:hypothetical protein